MRQRVEKGLGMGEDTVHWSEPGRSSEGMKRISKPGTVLTNSLHAVSHWILRSTL